MTTTWVITAATEPADLVNAAIKSICRSYSAASVVLIADQPRPDLASVAARFVQGVPLKNQPSGALWWHRLFTEAVKEPGTIIFKFDPDARVNRPLSNYPQCACFGTLVCVGTCLEHIQGGCQGFTRGAVEQILACGCLLDPAYKDWHTWAFGHGRYDYDYGEGEWKGYLSTDRIIMHVLRRLDLEWRDHPEISSYYLAETVPANQNTFAITHPHKTAD